MGTNSAMGTLVQTWNDWPLIRKIYLIMACMAALLVFKLIALEFATETLSGSRAFVAGEAVWSKAQKNAILRLRAYDSAEDEQEYQNFLKELDIVEGDRQARIEIEKPRPNLEIIRQGLIQGGNHPEDTDGMIALALRFKTNKDFAKSLQLWQEADEIIDQIRRLGAEYRQSVLNKDQNLRRKIYQRILELDESLTVKELQFSRSIGELSRKVEFWMLGFLSIIVGLANATGLFIGYLAIRRILWGINDLTHLAERFGQGRFSLDQPQEINMDELGRLKQSVLVMGERLANFYNRMEREIASRTADLQQAKDQLDVILSGINDGVIAHDNFGQVIYINNSGASICGLKAVGLNILNVSSFPDYFALSTENQEPLSWAELIAEPIQNSPAPEADRVIYLRQLQTQSERWVLATRKKVTNSADGSSITVTILKDFTERKLTHDRTVFVGTANQVLASSLDFEMTMQNLGQLLVPEVADTCTIRVLDLDDQSLKSFAYSHGELKADDPSQNSLKDTTNWGVENGAAEALRTGRPHLQNNEMLVPLIARSRPLGALRLGLQSPSRHWAPDQLELAECIGRTASVAIDNSLLFHQMERAVRSRDEFLSIVSHELKTPLTSLSLLVQIFRQSKTGPSFAAEILNKRSDRWIEILEQSVTRLSRLVDDLLDVSRIQSGSMRFEFTDLNLSDLLTKSIERMRIELKKAGCELIVNLEPEIHLKGDPGRLEQMIDNILSNSVKHAPGHPVTISLCQTGETIRLEVNDQGPGISPELFAKVFERFERSPASRNTPGLGLGLFIAKTIAEAHHGRIKVESPTGKGASFVIEIPAQIRTSLPKRAVVEGLNDA